MAVSAAILLGGTYAWQSISQTALNEKIVEVNPGGRLHDDFDGTNKDVYVENFGDTPIFAKGSSGRDMEIGAGAGLKTGRLIMTARKPPGKGRHRHQRYVHMDDPYPRREQHQ